MISMNNQYDHISLSVVLSVCLSVCLLPLSVCPGTPTPRCPISLRVVTSVEFSNSDQGSESMCLLTIDSDTYLIQLSSLVVHDNSMIGLDERSNSQARVAAEVSSITSHNSNAH